LKSNPLATTGILAVQDMLVKHLGRIDGVDLMSITAATRHPFVTSKQVVGALQGRAAARPVEMLRIDKLEAFWFFRG